MAALAITSPLPQFFDLDGEPLEGGLLYFGLVGQNPETAPVTVYWDAAATQPAAQPVRTLNGYAYRNGKPAVVYAATDYSLTVKDRRGRLIVSAANSSEFSNASILQGEVSALQTSIADLSDAATPTKGAAQIGRSAQVVSSVAALRLLSKLAPSKSAIVTGYYAAGDGGGGAYYLDVADTTTADNGGTIIVAADGGRWKMVVRESIGFRQFGARGDGGTDDLAAIQAAANYAAATGYGIRVQSGTFAVSGQINIATASVFTIRGEGRRASIIKQLTPGARTIVATTNYVTMSAFSIEYASQGTAGGNAITFEGCYYTNIDDLYIKKAAVGIEYRGGSNSNKATWFVCEDCTTNGVIVDGAVNVIASNFQILNGSTTLCSLGCIRLNGAVEGCNFFNGHTYQGAYSLTTSAPSYTFGARPAYNKFHGVYFDASANGAVIDKTTELDFVDCWFSSRPGNGAVISQSDGVRFTGGSAINNDLNGILVQADARRVVFKNFSARSNSMSAPNTYAGIRIAANTNDFVIQGCTFTNDELAFGVQKYGVEVQPGTSDRYVIADNLVAGNGTAGFVDGGTGLNKRVANNY